MAEPKPAGDWGASWEEQRRRKLTLGVAATPAQRLAWLEEMIRFAHRAGALPKRDSQRTVGLPYRPSS